MLQNFNRYTENDPNGRFVISADGLTITTSGLTWASNELGYVMFDHGVGHFSGNFTHHIRCKITSADANAVMFCWALQQTLGTAYNRQVAGDPQLAVYMQRVGAIYQIGLYESYLSTGYYSTLITISPNTQYYIKIVRDESSGNGTLSLYVYSDEAMTVPVGTRSLALHIKTDFRYITGASSWNKNDWPLATIAGIVSHMNINEGSTAAAVMLQRALQVKGVI